MWIKLFLETKCQIFYFSRRHEGKLPKCSPLVMNIHIYPHCSVTATVSWFLPRPDVFSYLNWPVQDYVTLMYSDSSHFILAFNPGICKTPTEEKLTFTKKKKIPFELPAMDHFSFISVCK